MPSKKGKRPPLYVIPNSAETWEAFGRFFDARKTLRPAPTPDALLVADARGLVAGVCLYPTSGPYVLVENLATNPGCPGRLRHRAVVLLVTLTRAYSATHSKFPIVIVRHRSLAKLLAKKGFHHQPGAILTSAAILEVP